MSDTPHTDEHEYGGDWETVVPAAFARSLERQLNEVLAERDELLKATNDALTWQYWRDRARKAEYDTHRTV